MRSKALCSRRRRRRYSEKEQLQTEERGKGRKGGKGKRRGGGLRMQFDREGGRGSAGSVSWRHERREVSETKSLRSIT